MKPKVCFFSFNLLTSLLRDSNTEVLGGAELQQLIIAKEMVVRGYKISFITLSPDSKCQWAYPQFNIVPTFRQKDGFPVLRFIYPRLFKVWLALVKVNADIYYIRGAGFYLAPLVVYAKLYNKKVVFCGANDTNFDPSKIKLPHYRDKIAYFWALKRCDFIIAQNNIQKKTALMRSGVNVRIIHNGYFRSKSLSSFSEGVLWVANFRKSKNPKLFLNLARSLPNCQFIMIGGRPEQEDFNVIAEEARQIPNLNFYGYLPIGKVEQFFLRAKLFVNTSSYEGFPNSFLQAWQKGLPVVSFVDPDSLISRNRLGISVKSFDEMINAVDSIVNNKIVFSPLRIQEFYNNNLTIDGLVDEYEKVFKSVSNIS
ncbi:glycosyltransferase family 4 protein [Deltaproteobacteria bacterium IMCC39524]|nr:glycosyltransferase family 4 protein [Deltaproteobacteria bacterium IMCC39524]